MTNLTRGFHHITAISGHPQITMDFYHGILGLRLVKQTVNFDDPNTYHFYFGDYKGSPGSILTFFPWAGARAGVIGDGQVSEILLKAPKGSLDFWLKRLTSFNVEAKKIKRFNETLIAFKDPFEMPLYLVEDEHITEETYLFDDITKNEAITGVRGVSMNLYDYTLTRDLLVNTFDYEIKDENDQFLRLKSTTENYTIDLRKHKTVKAEMGVGTIHHIALNVDSLELEQDYQRRLKEIGYYPTEVKDRNYFKSVYFKDNNHILFELATKNPGFWIDETLETLGEALKLPKQYEPYRIQIEQVLIPFKKRVLKKVK